MWYAELLFSSLISISSALRPELTGASWFVFNFSLLEMSAVLLSPQIFINALNSVACLHSKKKIMHSFQNIHQEDRWSAITFEQEWPSLSDKLFRGIFFWVFHRRHAEVVFPRIPALFTYRDVTIRGVYLKLILDMATSVWPLFNCLFSSRVGSSLPPSSPSAAGLKH